MKSWVKVVSKFLFALLVIDSITTTAIALSETTSEEAMIRDTYLKSYQEDTTKLSLTIDKEQTNSEQLAVKLKVAEGVIDEQGLTLILQSGLALGQNDQGQDILPEGFYRDETYNEDDRKATTETEETDDSLAKGLEQLPVYGEGYYSLRIKPNANRSVALITDTSDSSKRFEEHIFVFKKVSEVQTGEMVAVTNEHYLTILKENQSVFTNQETTEINASTEIPRGPGSITIQLRAYEENNPDPQVPLTESEFEISSVDHPEQTMKGKTDLNGNVTFENIALGSYTIKQLTSNSDYTIAEQIETVELTEAETTKTVGVTNTEKNASERQNVGISRSSRSRRAVTEATSNSTTTTVTNPDGTTTTYTREESIFKYIFKPITISIPGFYQSYAQDGVLKKKEVVVDSATNTTKIIWEYTTTVGGANSNITSIRNAFSTTMDSGLGEPRITSVKKNGTPITTNTTYYGSSDNFKSATDNLPVENGTYVYTIETPVVIPSDNYSLDYRSEVTVDAPKGSKLTYNDTSVTLSQAETRTLSTADTITLPAGNDGGPLGDLKVDTVNTSNVNRTIGKYRDGNDKVIEWTSSRLNDTSEAQTFTFDVALDNSQAVHENKVYIYTPTATGSYIESSATVVTPTNNQITVTDVPPGAIALVKTITNVTNEKANHTISGAQLEALKGDITIQKNWETGSDKVDVTFTANGGSLTNRTATISANTKQVTIANVDKFSGTGSTATKKRIYYEITEAVPSGYILSSRQTDWDTLTYLFTNKKDNTTTPIFPTGTCGNYGVTSIDPVSINYVMYQSGSTIWGGFDGSMRMNLKIPAFARAGDSFTLELPPELKLSHVANPNNVWTTVSANGKMIANVYHEKDNLLRFVLTADAYSVQEYYGWFEIGTPTSKVIKINNRATNELYKTGVIPNLPDWYTTATRNQTYVSKKLNFKSTYNGSGMNCEKTVQTNGTLDATNTDGSEGGLSRFGGMNKYQYSQTADTFTWELVYNAVGANIGSASGDQRKFWDFLHPGLELYPNGNVASSIPQSIEIYVADGTKAMSYSKDSLVKLGYKGTSQNGDVHHYGLPDNSIGVSVKVYSERNSDAAFDNFTSTHTIEFYHDGNTANKAIVVRLTERKKYQTNGLYYNGMSVKYGNPVLGNGRTRRIYRREGDTVSQGGAYPVDWYSLKLKKVTNENGQKRPLAGAVLTLYRGTAPYRTAVSDDDGNIQFSEITAGTYTFRETQAPPGYILDPTEHKIVITNSQNITIDGKQYDANSPTEVVNTKPATLQINKFELGEIQPLKGAVFRLKSKNGGNYDITIGNTLPASQFIFANLTKGTYTLTETKAPAGYKAISPIDIEVYEENGELKIRKLTDTGNTQTGAIEAINGNFSINVVDEDFSTEFTKVNEQGQPLADAVFELRQMTQTGYKRVLTGLTSNAQGKLRVDHLQGGTTYELWETSAPSGYSKLTTAAARFTVSDTGTITFASGGSQITNRPPTYKVKVQKVDALTGQKVTVQTRIGITDSQGHVIEGQISNFTNGEVSFPKNFAPGTYYIKEETTPSGYIGLSGLVPFTIRADGVVEVSSDYLEGIDVTTSSPDTITIKVKNYPLGKFKVSKRVKGISDMTNLITGQMTFTLTKNDDPNVTIVKQQAANQDFVFENLQPGVYTLTETQAPSGYIKSTETYTIHVDRDGSVRFYPNSDTSSHLATGLRVIKSAEIAAAATHGSSTEDKALDGTLTTGALYRLPNSTLNEGQWWGVDLGSVQRVTQILFAQGKNATDGSDRDKMDSYTLEYSSDGITYQSLGDFTTLDLTQSVDIYARYIRVRNLQTGTGRWLGIRDLQVSVRDATQTIDAGGSNDTANIIKIGNIENPEFKIEKVDSNNTQISKPVIFKLYKVDDSTTADTVSSVTLNDSNLVQTLTFTGQSSMTRLTATALGKYVLVEAQAPEGYDGLTAPVLLELEETTRAYDVTQQKAVTRFRVLSQTNSVSVTDLPAVSGVLANAISIKVKNTQKSYNFKVIKKDLTTNAGLDARFELYRENGSRVDAGNTTSSGENLVFRNLNPGVYVLKEVRTPSNYNGITDIKVQIAANGTLTVLEGPAELLTTSNADENREIRLTVKNVPFLEMSVQKLKKATGISLAGVRLKITALDQTPAPNFKDVTWHQNNYSGVANSTAKTVEWTTRADGDAVFLLPQGRYRLEEINAPSGYKQLEAFTFTVNASNQIVLGVDAPANLVGTTTKDNRLSIVLKNEFEKKIKVKKIDKTKQTLLAGAKFKLFASDQTTQIGDEKTTNSQGILEFTVTDAGTYYLQESQSPTGYVTNGKKYKLVVAEDGSVTTDNGDDNFAIGDIDATDRSTTITVKNERRSIKVKKRDYHNPATGLNARFELFTEDNRPVVIDGVGMKGTTSNADNSITFSNLPVGIYILKETVVPTGGYRPTTELRDIKFAIQADGSLRLIDFDSNMVTVDVSQGATLEITVKNFKFLEMSVQKLKKATGISLAGVRLKITALDQTPAPNFKDVTWHQNHYSGVANSTAKTVEWTTRADVDAVFLLPQGRYRLEEMSAPGGYKQLEAFTFTVNASNQIVLGVDAPANLVGTTTKDNRLSIVLKNEFEKKIKVKKIDKTKQTLLAGAKFKLFASDQTTQIGDEKTTNSQGILEFTVTDAGTYYLQESQSPTGYVTNGKKYKLVVAEDGSVTTDNGDDNFAIGDIDATDRSTTITVKNERRSIKVKKRDYHNPATGLNARFELFTEDNRPVVIDGVGMKGTTSNADNSITFSNLPVGIYILKETVVPTGGYRPVSELQDIKFEIQANGTLRLITADTNMVSVDASQGNTIELTIKNFKQFTFKLQKTDSGDENHLLDGARFTIYRDADNNGVEEEVVASGVTTNGVFETPLSFGYYILQETTAPTGYQVNTKKYRFQINHDGTTFLHNGDDTVTLAERADGNNIVLFTMKNTKQTSYFKLAKRDYRDSTQRLEATFELKEANKADAIPIVKQTATTGDDVSFENLDLGKTYILKETIAPDGYQLIQKEYRIDVGTDGAITIHDGGDLVSLDGTDTHLIIVKNLRKGEYPQAGGMGAIPYIALGGVMMLVALAVELRRKNII
ncbi:SpaA isopeptide-forming pilin-related protein [Streptococcus suis]|uniref:SpaA isopeptide-forming pilin-related protein n=9 Tax=Streptococcus suis TaxID=1307 RepID=UPI00211DE874|nr:SpaA isopeptide-forming pilin-related protein [Streptococcus suis]